MDYSWREPKWANKSLRDCWSAQQMEKRWEKWGCYWVAHSGNMMVGLTADQSVDQSADQKEKTGLPMVLQTAHPTVEKKES